MNLILKDFFVINGTATIARMRFFIYNLSIIVIAYFLPFLPALFNIEFSFSYFILTLVFVVVFSYISVNILAKRFRDIGMSTPYNIALTYTFFELLLVLKYSSLICDIVSYAVIALICIIPSGYMAKKH